MIFRVQILQIRKLHRFNDSEKQSGRKIMRWRGRILYFLLLKETSPPFPHIVALEVRLTEGTQRQKRNYYLFCFLFCIMNSQPSYTKWPNKIRSTYCSTPFWLGVFTLLIKMWTSGYLFTGNTQHIRGIYKVTYSYVSNLRLKNKASIWCFFHQTTPCI